MVPKEANNSNNANVTSTESNTPLLWRQMVSKEANTANIKNVPSILCNKMVRKEANNSNNANVTSTYLVRPCCGGKWSRKKQILPVLRMYHLYCQLNLARLCCGGKWS